MLKLMKRSGIYRNSTSTLVVNAVNLNGTSYNWYVISDTIGGVPVLNTYRYSPTTGKHIREVRDLFRRLGVREYLEIDAPRGLQNLIEAEGFYIARIARLREEIATPRTSPKKNELRRSKIRELEQTLSMIRVLQE